MFCTGFMADRYNVTYVAFVAMSIVQFWRIITSCDQPVGYTYSIVTLNSLYINFMSQCQSFNWI